MSVVDSNRWSGARTVLRALDNRVQLAGLELDEARGRMLGTGLLAVAALVAFQLLLAAGMLVLVALTWDTSWRVLAPALAGGSFGILAIVAGWLGWSRLRAWRPFAETLTQISADLNLIKSLLLKPQPTSSNSEDSDGS